MERLILFFALCCSLNLCCDDLDIEEIIRNATLEETAEQKNQSEENATLEETVEQKKQSEEKDENVEVVDIHNFIRRLEGASNMNKLIWDNNLARMALEWAQECKFLHGGVESSEFDSVGQNMYTTSSVTHGVNYTSVVMNWKSEKNYYDFSTQTCSRSTCGHYTQAVWADSLFIGCGYKLCEPIQGTNIKKGYLVICDYYPPGNFPGEDPYIPGEPCEMCPGTCDLGLCVAEL